MADFYDKEVRVNNVDIERDNQDKRLIQAHLSGKANSVRRRFYQPLKIMPIGETFASCIFEDCQGARLLAAVDFRLSLTDRCEQCGQAYSNTNKVNEWLVAYHRNEHLRQAS